MQGARSHSERAPLDTRATFPRMIQDARRWPETSTAQRTDLPGNIDRAALHHKLHSLTVRRFCISWSTYSTSRCSCERGCARGLYLEAAVAILSNASIATDVTRMRLMEWRSQEATFPGR